VGCLREPRDLEPRDLPLAPARPPEAGQYRPRRCTAKPPKQRQGQRGREPRQGRALREHGLSEPRTRLQPQHRSAHPPANGAEETSQPAGFHGCCFSRGIGDLLTLGRVVYANKTLFFLRSIGRFGDARKGERREDVRQLHRIDPYHGQYGALGLFLSSPQTLDDWRTFRALHLLSRLAFAGSTDSELETPSSAVRSQVPANRGGRRRVLRLLPR